MKRILRLTLAAVAGLTVACSTATTGGTSASGDTPRQNRNILTQEQLRETPGQNLYQAIESRRSNWLRTRGTDSFRNPGQIWVYVDQTKLGGIESLRGISTLEVQYVQWYSGTEATGRWGLDHGNGVIFVSTSSR